MGTRDQVQAAAEQTIEAAAAALLWVGPDAHGVLEHVANASAERMVSSRYCYWVLESVRCQYGPDEQQAFEKDLIDFVSSNDFEVAALPASAAPTWTDSVREAISDVLCAARESPTQRDDEVERRRVVELSARGYALRACSYWGRDILQLDMIEEFARVVDRHTALAIGQFLQF